MVPFPDFSPPRGYTAPSEACTVDAAHERVRSKTRARHWWTRIRGTVDSFVAQMAPEIYGK